MCVFAGWREVFEGKKKSERWSMALVSLVRRFNRDHRRQTLNIGMASLGLKSDAFQVGRWDAIAMDLGISSDPLLYLLMLIITSSNLSRNGLFI